MLARSADQPFFRDQLFQRKGAAGMKFLGGDPDLGAQTQRLSVREPGRSVGIHRRGVDLR